MKGFTLSLVVLARVVFEEGNMISAVVWKVICFFCFGCTGSVPICIIVILLGMFDSKLLK